MRSAATQKLCRSWRRALPCCRPCGASPGLTVLRALPSKMWRSITASLSTYNPSLHTFRQFDCAASYSCVHISQCYLLSKMCQKSLPVLLCTPQAIFQLHVQQCHSIPGTFSLSLHTFRRVNGTVVSPMCYPRHCLTPCAIQDIILLVCKQASS